MVHDGWSPYDFFKQATHQQCLEHLLRRGEGLLERATRGAVRFPRKVKEFLSDALALRDRRADGVIRPHGLAVARGRLEKRLDRLLQWNLSHHGNRTLAGGHAQEVLGSVFATLAKRALDALSFLSRVICLPASRRPYLIQQLLPAPSN